MQIHRQSPPFRGFRSLRGSTAFALAAIASVIAAQPGAAQGQGCASQTYTDPPREVFHCPGSMTITAERGAEYRLIDRNRDGKPEAAELASRGLLVETPGGKRGRFQILTPHAIASVRGTIWAVDVEASRTSVFVQHGTVGVARRGVGEEVRLTSGEGVDVVAGAQGGLEVTQWGKERAAHLLARFGR